MLARAAYRRLLARTGGFSPAARQFLVFSLLLSTAFAIFNLVFNLYMSALGFSNEVIGLFNSLPAIALLAVGLPAAAMADRLGYRLFLLGGGGLAVVASLTLAIVQTPLLAVLAAGAFALAVIVLGVLGSPLLTQLSSQTERVAVFSFNESLAWLATLIGDLVGGVIPEAAARMIHASSASATALRSAFVATAVLALLSLPFLFQLVRGADLKPVAMIPVRELLQVDVARFGRILLPSLILGIAAGMYLNFVQLYLAQRFGLTPGPIGVILAVGAALTVAVTLAAPAVSRRLGITRTIGLAQIVGSPLVLALAFLMVLPIAVVVMYVRQLALNLQGPLGQVFGMEYVEGSQRARLATAQAVVSGVGVGGIGPLLSGFLQVRGGYQLAFSISAVFYLLAGLTFLWLFGKVRLPSERET
ncbi:MAG: MFS transporter [Candidatus Dormibacteraeota bacterium]|nr:MFS transporter [Candidatus Dormibacteraeota bacterium]